MKDSSDNSAREKKPARFLTVLLFNLAIFITILYAFEIYLRATDPRADLPPHGEIEDKLDPSKKSEYTWGHLVKYNRFNFREREFEVPKPGGVYRVMVLGDSLTFGAGLSVDERYTNLLEARLNKEFSNDRLTFEVLNFGVEGVPTLYEKEILLSAMEIVRPDLIIVGFCVNDPCLRGEENTIEKEEFDKRWRVYIKSVKSGASMIGLKHTAESFEMAMYRFAEKRGSIPKWQDALDRSYDRSSLEWKAFTGALAEIKEMSDKEGLPRPIMAILTQPAYLDRPTNYLDPSEEELRYIRWYEQAEEAGKEIGFRTINYKEEFIERFSNEYAGVNRLDRHPGAKLNRLYSEKLFDTIKDNYLNGKRRSSANTR